MKQKILEIINKIRLVKGLAPVEQLKEEDNLREDIGFSIEDEFDIDIFEDGFVNTVGEIYAKLKK